MKRYKSHIAREDNRWAASAIGILSSPSKTAHPIYCVNYIFVSSLANEEHSYYIATVFPSNLLYASCFKFRTSK
jgi:hypothetical protein